MIPHVPLNKEADDRLSEVVSTLHPYDELIVVVNDAIGFSKAVNRGLRLARGDYVAIINNDAFLRQGSLEDLCVPGSVASPIIDGKSLFYLCFCVIPRTVIDALGGFNTRFGIGFGEDSDYAERCQRAGIPLVNVSSVVVHHMWMMTNRHIMPDIPNQGARNGIICQQLREEYDRGGSLYVPMDE